MTTTEQRVESLTAEIADLRELLNQRSMERDAAKAKGA